MSVLRGTKCTFVTYETRLFFKNVGPSTETLPSLIITFTVLELMRSD